MKRISIHSSLAGIAVVAMAAAALALPLHDAEARRISGSNVHNPRAMAPIVGTHRSLGVVASKVPGGPKAASGGAVSKLKCVGPYCAPQRPSVPKATTTGTNKANPSPTTGVVIRDHRRPTCYAPGHCKPARFYFYQGQRYLLQPYGR